MTSECPKVVGARIDVCVEGWEATVQMIADGDMHSLSFPLRISEALAREDIKRAAPGFPQERIVVAPVKTVPK